MDSSPKPKVFRLRNCLENDEKETLRVLKGMDSWDEQFFALRKSFKKYYEK
jgi:hypothetical protein